MRRALQTPVIRVPIQFSDGIELRILVIAVLASVFLLPGAAEEEPVYDLGDGITPPRLTRQVNPNYSSVRGVKVKGSVAIALIVSSQGLPKEPRVVKSLEPEVDRAAVEAVKQWRFAPAVKEGRAVAVKVTVELEFRGL
jgi:TonB family protein